MFEVGPNVTDGVELKLDHPFFAEPVGWHQWWQHTQDAGAGVTTAGEGQQQKFQCHLISVCGSAG